VSIHFATYRKAKRGEIKCCECGSYTRSPFNQRGRCGRMHVRLGIYPGIAVGASNTCATAYLPNATSSPRVVYPPIAGISGQPSSAAPLHDLVGCDPENGDKK
jgi:hypothetical protein